MGIGVRRHPFADRELSPGALALGRLLVGSATLGMLVLVRRAPLPGRRELGGIVVCGVLWFGVYNVALNAAERRVDAGTAAMLVNVGPILIAILAGVILHEGFPPRLLAGCLVSFAGAVVIGVATSRHGLHESLGARPVPGGGGRLRRRGRRPEARAPPRLAADGHLARVHGRGRHLPPLRGLARPRARPRRRLDDRAG